MRSVTAYAFFGVAGFFAGAFLLFFGAIVLATEAGALDLVTRPDFVLPRTTGGFSSTAGACDDISTVLNDDRRLVVTYGNGSLALRARVCLGLALRCCGLLGWSLLRRSLSSSPLSCCSLLDRGGLCCRGLLSCWSLLGCSRLGLSCLWTCKLHRARGACWRR